MKRYLKINAMKYAIGDDAFAQLCRLVPEAATPVTFDAKLRDNDTRLDQVIPALQSGGGRAAEPWDEPTPQDYMIRPIYKYEPSDFQAASYLEPIPIAHAQGLHRDDDGTLLLDLNRLPRRANYASTGVGTSVVSDTFRQELQAEGLRGLQFRPTRARRARSRGPVVVEWQDLKNVGPYWELTASVELPPVSPKLRVLTAKGEVVPRGDTTRGVQIYEGVYPAGELHYVRRELEVVGPFDLALTRERFGNTADERNRRLVVSTRFKEICDQRKLQVVWYPVFVDDE